MSSASRNDTPTARATGPCATSGSTLPAALPSMSPTSPAMSPTPSPTSPSVAPTRIRSLAPLLTRDNVKAILGLSEIKSLRVLVEFADGSTDSKSINMAPGGSAALLLLDDNPDGIPSGAFYDIRP